MSERSKLLQKIKTQSLLVKRIDCIDIIKNSHTIIGKLGKIQTYPKINYLQLNEIFINELSTFLIEM